MGQVFRIANLVGFQAAWVACVWGAANGLPWLGPVAVLAFVAGHLRFTPTRASDLRMLAIAIPMGLLVDTVFVLSGFFDYASPWPVASVAPLWIVAMWVGFALTLNHSMAFLRARLGWAALFGLVGGPLAYWGAQRGFDAVEFVGGPAVALGLVALAWAIALPALYGIESRWSRAPKAEAA